MIIIGTDYHPGFQQIAYVAANTINQQLAAVRRLAHEAADTGLLSPELAAGISTGERSQAAGISRRQLVEHRAEFRGAEACLWEHHAR